jgi:hypothetical protein
MTAAWSSTGRLSISLRSSWACCAGILDHRDPAAALHRGEARGAEERVHRGPVQVLARAARQAQHPVAHQQVMVGRGHVDLPLREDLAVLRMERR